MDFDDHERRKRKQEIQSRSHQDHPPSTEKDVYWIYARRMVGKYPRVTTNAGKWLIFVPAEHIDEKWSIIKKAVENGELGEIAKVSTMKSSSLANDPNQKVLCVYTYDWTDKEDVMRIRNRLKDLGFTTELVYKSDEDTRQGKYLWKGDQVVKYKI